MCVCVCVWCAFDSELYEHTCVLEPVQFVSRTCAWVSKHMVMVMCALGFVCAHMCHEPIAVLNLYNIILRTLPMKIIIILKIKIIFINTDKMRPTVVPQIPRDGGQYTHGPFW